MVIIVYLQGNSLLIMQISIMHWCVEIEMPNPTHKTRFVNLKSLWVAGLSSGYCLGIRFVVFVGLILSACGDIELNPGPEKELLLQFLSLPLEFKQHHCTQFCKHTYSNQ